jgi:hypothetical protein
MDQETREKLREIRKRRQEINAYQFTRWLLENVPDLVIAIMQDQVKIVDREIKKAGEK